MMGKRTVIQQALFYGFSFEEVGLLGVSDLAGDGRRT